MILEHPVCIGPTLDPALRLETTKGVAWLSVHFVAYLDHRSVFNWLLLGEDGKELGSGTNLSTPGCGITNFTTVHMALDTLLAFMSDVLEDPENDTQFSQEVRNWLCDNQITVELARATMEG